MTMHWLNHDRPTAATRHLACALWLALGLLGCGGVDSGGTGSPTYASGPITGFGSVIVNGVHFDDSSAAITDDDGTPRSRDDLRLGMTTEIRGSTLTTDASGTSTSQATTIAFRSELLGRVDAIDTAGNTLVVLGQTVVVNATTVFDDASLGGGLSALAVGDTVEVYALFDAATGRYAATRIERKAAVLAYRLRGMVSQLDLVAKTFNIGSERISYAALAGPAPTALANGNFLRVRVQTAKVGGAWLVAALADGRQRLDDLDTVRLEGLISAFVSPTQFSVNGVAVSGIGISPPAGLALGVRVEVEGTVRGGVLVASKLTVKAPNDPTFHVFELRGPIVSVDPARLAFVLRGVTVRYRLGGLTDFRDGTAAQLVSGASIEARGLLSADGTQLVATRITFK
jgi:Domain of unknown function (DUF5666)